MAEKTHRSLPCVRVRVRIRFRRGGVISRSWTPTLRGGFGTALRKISCALRRDVCTGCPLNRTCAYGYLFETPVTETDVLMRKYPRAPHPFVFEPDGATSLRAAPNDTGSLALVLIGGSYVYLPYVFLALQELGKAGLGRDRIPYEIVQLTMEDGAILYEASCGRGLRPARPVALGLDPGPSCRGRFALEFETALRLQHEGALCTDPDLAAIVAALRRRLFLLQYFHAGGCAEALADEFLEAACDAVVLEKDLRWHDAQRSSTRQQRIVPMGGLRGRIVCEGDIGILEPLLRAGEYVHVGKNATFGLGKFRLLLGDDK